MKTANIRIKISKFSDSRDGVDGEIRETRISRSRQNTIVVRQSWLHFHDGVDRYMVARWTETKWSRVGERSWVDRDFTKVDRKAEEWIGQAVIEIGR